MRERVKQILGELKNDLSFSGKLSDSSSIIDDVGLDSLQMINFFLKIEDEFDVEIEFDAFDFAYLSSIGAFCSFIEKCCERVDITGGEI